MTDATVARAAQTHPRRLRRPRQPEKVEQAAIVQLLQSLGDVWVIGTRRPRGDWQGTCQTPGFPDLVAFLRGPWKGPLASLDRTPLFVEVKAPGGQLRPAQARFRDCCEAAAVHHVVGGVDDVIAWLLKYEFLRNDQVAHYRRPG